MAKRNTGNFSLIWVHLNATHPAYGAIIDTCRRMHEQYDELKLSINLNHDGTEALVKVATNPHWPALSAWGPILFRVYTEDDHAEAVAMVRSPEWEGI